MRVLEDACQAHLGEWRGRRGRPAPPLGGRGANLRLTELQAGLLLAQMTRLEDQSKTREENARYLTQAAARDPRHPPREAQPER